MNLMLFLCLFYILAAFFVESSMDRVQIQIKDIKNQISLIINSTHTPFILKRQFGIRK